MIRRLLLALVALLLVTGCSGVPERSDPVVVGPPPSGADDADSAGIQPGGPDPGAPTDEIVRGFIKALTATDTSYAVAREFLVPEVRKSWSPSEDVTIIDPSVGATPGAEEGTVRFNAKRLARVDEQGTYHLDAGAIDYGFRLKQVKGQWRIVNPPGDLVIDSKSFQSLYKDASIYFADPSGTRLVPDVRYFRTNLQQRANRLVQALIDGPISALADGVRNELSGGVKLRSAVTYKPDLITVDLTGLGQKSEAQRRIVSAQIMWTLNDLGATSARITNDGDPLQMTGVGDIQTTNDWDQYDPGAYPFNAAAYYIDGGGVVTETGAKVPGPVGSGEYAISEAALSVDGTRIAAISAGAGQPVLRTGGINEILSVVDLPGTTTLTTPTWGPSTDEFWVVRNGTEIVRVSSKGAPKSVGVSALADLGPIRRIALSRDGARLAVIAGVPGGAGRLYVATVQTTADAVTVINPVLLSADLDVSAVVWRDARTLAILGRPSPTGTVFPYTMLVDDSQRQQLPAPVLSGEAVAIAAAPGKAFLCSINQTVLKLRDSTWVSLTPGVVVSGARPFYPG
ncbi:LpqB family beta-propeller domain-containing protein [Cumulibacter manganitolerans]|uniref:LpqB family beta-propeller domain-containing protein n=1 Tax=Cumulibacter manganitolerans TaxID=1884992 RepID=UPI001297EFC8|nr:LpqB family beta-propeller domain-containing protein [Cumulibacter manganitolerans]